LNARGAPGVKLAREVRRNLNTNIRFAFPDRFCQFSNAMDFAHHSKGLRIDELIDELPALGRAVLIEHQGGHMLHVGIERISERNHFHDRREEHEEQRQRITQDDQELLVENRRKTAEGCFHFCAAVWL